MSRKQNKPFSEVIRENQFLTPDTLEALSSGPQVFRQLKKDNPFWFQIMEIYKPVLKQIRPYQQMLTQVLDIKQTISTYVSQRKKMAGYINSFSTRGWYISGDFAQMMPTTKIETLMQSHPENWDSAIDTVLIQTFRGDFADLKHRILEIAPNRADLLEEVFKLWESDNYYPLVTLGLSQVDGICKDNFQISEKGVIKKIGFFESVKGGNKPRPQLLAGSFKLENDSIFAFLTNQLADKDKDQHVLLQVNSKQPSDLNRNAIMHGEALDFGTEINAAKIILLLDFVGELVVLNRYLNYEKIK